MPLPVHYSQPTTLEQIAKHTWDLKALPRQRVFEILSQNCDDEMEKWKLDEFCSAEGLEGVIAYVNRPRRTISEVLFDFPKSVARLNLQLVFEIFQVIQAKSFSIASVPAAKSIDLLVAVVEYKTKLSEPRKGLCSNWLKGLGVGETIYAAVKPGTMKLPVKNVPIVMVGPGTGIAPFRSVLLERYSLETKAGRLLVFFGCRNREKDFHFRNDFEKFQAEGIAECFFAFSRDQDSKVYVQHLIESNASTLRDLILNENGVILVAGSSKNMPKAVKDAFVEAIGGDRAYIDNMIKTKRYQEETWS